MMTLSQRLAAERAAKVAKKQAREDKRPVKTKPATSLAVQNRMLLASEQSRFSAEELLNHQLQIHLFINWVLSEHHLTAVYYLQTLLETIKALNIIQPRPKRMQLVEKAQAELEGSATAGNRHSHFLVLKPLLMEYADELATSSRMLQVDCNIHAYHSLLLRHTSRLIYLPWQIQAFTEVVDGMTLKVAAQKYQVSEFEVKAAVLEVADILYRTNFMTYKDTIPHPTTMGLIRRYAKHYRMYSDDAKNVAEASAKSMVDFKKMYGESLIDVAELAEQVKAA